MHDSEPNRHGFTSNLSRIINTGQSRSIILTGNVYDLFGFCEVDEKLQPRPYVPLLNYLVQKYDIPPKGETSGLLVVTYALNDNIEIHGNKESISNFVTCWQHFKNTDLTDICVQANGNPTFALEVMRQMSMCSRRYDCFSDLLFVIEGADMIVPEEQFSKMNVADRRRVAVIHNWFSDPQFMDGRDSVVLIAESRSQIHGRISKLPQVIGVEIPYPDTLTRGHYLIKQDVTEASVIAAKTAGLSIHALKQLVRSNDLSEKNIFKKVEQYIVGQLGEGVVEFKVPVHTFEGVIGFSQIKKFFKEELIPAFKTDKDDEAITGAVICGPIGGGKTFICEALAAEMNMPVLVLKNFRNMYYGQTDVIFERLFRTLTALDKIVIFMDEADTVLGGVESSHDTERRVSGKFQSMMSDPRLKGKVLWLLMTARVHRLSPDIKRPGRGGDFIIPILDPEGEDYIDFVDWVFGDVEGWEEYRKEQGEELVMNTIGKSAAYFASLRSAIKRKKCETIDEAVDIAGDILDSDIVEAREYQKLQALLNCTRKSLMPKGSNNQSWRKRARELEKLLT